LSEALWWRHLSGDPSAFLLDDAEPGVVWRTLVTVLGRPHDAPAVVRAREQARSSGAAAQVLAGQDAFGFWGSPSSYGVRWGGSVWHLMAAAALGADPDDPRAARGVDTLLEQLQPRTGGFSVGRGKMASACFTAELCWALSRFGYAHHPRVREALVWLAERGERESGWSCPDLRHHADGACPVAAVAVLRLGGEAPAQERRPLQGLLQRAASWLLDRKLLLDGPSPRGWLAFSHPNLAQADLLDAVAAMARLHWPADPAILRSVGVVLRAQDGLGTWRQQRRTPFGEPLGQASRWVTLKALQALATYGDSLPAAGTVGDLASTHPG
jgi:hypothetical protein